MSIRMWSTFPNGLPPAVKHAATETLRRLQKKNEHEALEVLHRLVFDPRMQNVWKELYRKRRVGHKRTEEFVYPAHYSLPADPEWMTQQDAAVMHLFGHAHQLAIGEHKLLTLSEARTLAASLQKTARNLRNGAETIRSIEDMAGILGWAGADELQHIAAACEGEARSILGLVPSLVSRRHRGDERLRAYVAWLATTTKRFFGTPMYTTLATIANVALDRKDVRDDRVKEILSWLRGLISSLSALAPGLQSMPFGG